jgi:hypothetical protein
MDRVQWIWQIRSKRFQTKLKMYTKRNQNWYSEWIHLVDVHLFCVEHTIKRTMVILTRTVYGHCEDAGPTPPWRCSRWVCPAASALTADSHQNRWVCHAAPCRTPTIYATATSINIFSPKRMNTHTRELFRGGERKLCESEGKRVYL